MNAAVELHDSEVTAVFQTGATVVIRLERAYVHRSLGRPGIDPGSGWSQPVELRFANGVIESSPIEFPVTLDDGFLSGGTEYRNCVPLPLTMGSEVHFEARTMHDERLAVHASAMEAVPVGAAEYVEEFLGMAT